MANSNTIAGRSSSVKGRKMEKCESCEETIEGTTEQIRDSGWMVYCGKWFCQTCADNLTNARHEYVKKLLKK